MPDYDFVVIDEAHNIEQVAEDHFGIDISNYRFTFLLNRIFNPRTNKGLLAHTSEKKLTAFVRKCSSAAKLFFDAVEQWYEAAKDKTNGKAEKDFVTDCVSAPLKQLRLALLKHSNASDSEDYKYELISAAEQCKALEADVENFLKQSRPDNVYWVEVEKGRRTTVCLKSAPLNVGADVKRVLFDEYDSVILTSATLSSDGADVQSGFEFFAGRVGLENFEGLKLGSPFDYEKNVTIYIEADLPEPTDKNFVLAAAEAVKKYVRLTHGRAFVLFTSYTTLNSIAAAVADWLEEQNIALLRQGAGIDRSQLLHRFKEGLASVLFGTDSFWQGVDVPGDALSNVIIVRLPFDVPNQPLLQGRFEQIRQSGGNPFFDYQLPNAIIKFKQGFGRLIRTKTDKGIIVILDSRIVRKGYGQQFLSAIPQCRVEIVGK